VQEGGNDSENQSFQLMQQLDSHTDIVRSVDWAQNIGLKEEMTASCSDDGSLYIWKKPAKDGFKEHQKIQSENKVPFWKVNWSPVGHMLAVSTGDNKVVIYKEDHTGLFVEETALNDEGVD
jgi:protein transport protein SEC13